MRADGPGTVSNVCRRLRKDVEGARNQYRATDFSREDAEGEGNLTRGAPGAGDSRRAAVVAS
jgi:hypothetical protein